MQFKSAATVLPSLDPKLQWIWYSAKTASFIVGDERSAFALPIAGPAAMRPLAAERPFDPAGGRHHPCNLPIPNSLYDEFAAQSWHGFRFLESSAYDKAVDQGGQPIGDLLRTLVFAPDYGHYVLHPLSGMVLGLRSGAVELLRRGGEGFVLLEKTRTRGKAAMAFAAHPSESVIAYGDNSGAFHAQRFDANGFGKASRIAACERKASRLEFVCGGGILALGGMGYLATYSCAGGKFAPLHRVSMPVRDFLWLDDGQLVIVNQGLHGVIAYRYGDCGFSKLAEVKPDGAVQSVAVSTCRRYIACTMQDAPQVNVLELA